VPQNAGFFWVESCLAHIILMFFVNHAQKFKVLVKRMSYMMADCCHLNPSAKGLILDEGLF
jgi:hypothetical protein